MAECLTEGDHRIWNWSLWFSKVHHFDIVHLRPEGTYIHICFISGSQTVYYIYVYDTLMYVRNNSALQRKRAEKKIVIPNPSPSTLKL